MSDIYISQKLRDLLIGLVVWLTLALMHRLRCYPQATHFQGYYDKYIYFSDL